MINIIDNGVSLEQLPNIPFVIKDNYGNYFMIVQDENSDEFRYVNLKDGGIKTISYKSLKDMFTDGESRNDTIVDCDLIIKTK